MKGFTHTGRGPQLGHDFSKKVPTVDSFTPGAPSTMQANGSTLHPSAGKKKAFAPLHFARGGRIPPEKVAARQAKGKRVGTMKKADGGFVPPGGMSPEDNEGLQAAAAAPPPILGRTAPMMRDPRGMPLAGNRSPASNVSREAAVQREIANPRAQQAIGLLSGMEKAGVLPKNGPLAQMSQFTKSVLLKPHKGQGQGSISDYDRANMAPVKRAEGGVVGNALTQRSEPTTEQDRDGGGRSPLRPGFRRGGRPAPLGTPQRAGKPASSPFPKR